MALEVIRAIKVGTTRSMMAMLILASYAQAGQLVLLDSTIMARAKLETLAYFAPPMVWAVAYVIGASLMLWRLMDRTPRPAWAWAANTVTTMLWLSNYLAPAVGLRDAGFWAVIGALMSPFCVFPIAAAWVMVRTQSTPRDRAQA